MDPVRWFWDQFVRGRVASPETAGYRRLVWSTKQLVAGAVDKSALKVFDCDGDHLTIFRVHGAAPVYVRLGPDENPFMPVYSRMVYARPFRRVTFADASIFGGAQLPTENYESRVLAYASHGPLVLQFPPREYGIKRNPYMRNDLVATTIATDLMSLVLGAALTNNGAVNSTASTVGLEGATLLVLNQGPSDLYLCRAGGAFGGGNGLAFGPIVPGGTLALELDDLPFNYTTALDSCGLGFKTLVNTATFSILLSRSEMNGAEGFQNVPSVSGIS